MEFSPKNREEKLKYWT